MTTSLCHTVLCGRPYVDDITLYFMSLPLLLSSLKVRHKVCRTLWQDAKYDYFMSYSTLWQALRRRHNFILYVFTPSLVVSRVVALIYI
jgi:hypothetical protein